MYIVHKKINSLRILIHYVYCKKKIHMISRFQCELQQEKSISASESYHMRNFAWYSPQTVPDCTGEKGEKASSRPPCRVQHRGDATRRPPGISHVRIPLCNGPLYRAILPRTGWSNAVGCRTIHRGSSRQTNARESRHRSLLFVS